MKIKKNEFYRKLFVLVLPITMQNLMTALVSASDALMLGLLNQSALAAVSLAAQVQFILNLFYAALTIGTTVLGKRRYGLSGKDSGGCPADIRCDLMLVLSGRGTDSRSADAHFYR